MITNKLKLGLLEGLLATVMGLVLLGGASYANAAAIAYTADGFVTIGSTSYKISSGSAATSLVIAGTTLTVIIPTSSTFTLSSLEGYKLNSDAGTANTCSGQTSSVTFSGAATVIITPNTGIAACTSSSGGGGGGGGGGSAAKKTTPATPAAPATPATTVSSGGSLGQQVSALVAQLKSLVAILESRGVIISAEVKNMLNTWGVPAGGMPTYSATFTGDLDVGMSGPQVTALQNWLIKKGYAVPAGATGFYGGQTKAAVAAYQKANGISPAVGMFGPKTRAHVQMNP